MIFKIPRLIEHISAIMTLEVGSALLLTTTLLIIVQEGDLILTGTPSGVGAVVPGDKVECALADGSGKQLAALDFVAVAREGSYKFVPES